MLDVNTGFSPGHIYLGATGSAIQTIALPKQVAGYAGNVSVLPAQYHSQ
jgi:hypothetical protein